MCRWCQSCVNGTKDEKFIKTVNDKRKFIYCNLMVNNTPEVILKTYIFLQ